MRIGRTLTLLLIFGQSEHVLRAWAVLEWRNWQRNALVMRRLRVQVSSPAQKPQVEHSFCLGFFDVSG